MEDGCGQMKGDSGIIFEDVYEDGMWNLGGKLVLMLMRAGVLFLVFVFCTCSGGGGNDGGSSGRGNVSFWKTFFVSDGGGDGVFRGEFWAGGRWYQYTDILDLGEDFVAMVEEKEVYDVELEIGVVVRLVWYCLNRRLYFLWHLSRMSLEG